MKNQNLLPQKAKNRFFVTSFWVVFLFIFSFLFGSSGVEAKTINLGDQPTDIINVIGQLGIKTGAPSALLEIASSTNKEGLRIITSNYSPFIIRNAANTADLFRIDQNGNIIGGNAGSWILNGTNLYPNNTSYNVGIGTTEPNQKLDVVGNMQVSGYIRGVTIKGTVATEAATAAKIVSIDNYTPVAGDLLAITFTSGNTVSYPTLNINNLGAKNIRLNNSNVNTTNFYMAASSTVLMYYDGDYYQIMGSQRTADSTVDANMHYSINKVMGAPLYRYKMMAEGSDGRYYPLTLESGTATTKTVTTQPLKVGGNIFYYNGTATVATDAVVSNTYSEINHSSMHYTFNQSGGYINYRPIYLVGTIDSSGFLVLDNSTATSFYTQKLPTSEDGKVYVYLGQVYSTNSMRLNLYHPIYEYKNGRVQFYVPDTFWTKNSSGKMWNLNSGDIGIGTAAPDAKLDVNGSLRVIASSVTFGILGGGGDRMVMANNAGDLFATSTPTSLWGNTGSNIYSLAPGNVGIGTTNPGAKLDVVGGAIRTNNQLISTVANGTAPLIVTSGTKVTNLNADLLDDVNSDRIQYLNSTVGEVLNASTLTAPIRTYRTTAGGTNFPVATNNGGVLQNFIAYDSNYGYQTFAQVSAGNIYWRTKSAGTWGSWKTVYDNGNLTNTLSTNYISKWNGSKLANSLIYDNGTNVGISTNDPKDKLHVAGNVRISELLNCSGANSAVKTDASGRLICGTVAGGVTGSGTASYVARWTGASTLGTGVLYDNGTYVGINKTSPAHALDVVGVINATTGYRFNNAATTGQYLRGNGTNFVASAIQASDVPTLNQNTTGSAGSAAVLTHEDNRAVLPSELGINRLKFGFTSYGNNSSSPYADFLHMRSYQDSSGGSDNLVVFNKSGLGMRIYQQTFGSTSPYATYKDVMLSDNGPTANYITKYTNTGTTVSAGKSIIYDNGTNVGISTNDPKDKLHVAGNVRISGLLNCSGANSAVKTDASGRLICGTISGGVTGSGTANYSTRWTGSSTLGTGVLYDNGTSVGIGTSGPLSNLDVVGTFRAGSSGGGVRFNDDGTAAYFQALSSANGARDMFLKARNLIFHTGNPYSERLRINSDGNVGIGIANPTQKLTISGTSIASETTQTNISAYANNGLRIVGNGSAGSQDAITYQAGGSGGGAAIAFRRDSSYGTFIDFYTNNSNVTGGIARAMTINRYGRVGIGTSLPHVDSKLDVAGNVYALGFNYNSDIRLKKNIKDIDNPLHKILNLRGVTFDWRADGRPSLGLIAQEVEKVFPELVSQGEGMKAVQYGNLVAPLIEAVKEQQRIISNLEARIMILEKQIN